MNTQTTLELWVQVTGERNPWIRVRDGDPLLLRLADRHYSRKTRGAGRCIGPGEYLALLTPEGGAAFVWRVERLRLDGQQGVECTLFRNERPDLYLSSYLIRKAVELARRKWPSEKRFFTYVNPRAVRSGRPGWCFLKAGWREAGRSKSGLLILEVAEK